MGSWGITMRESDYGLDLLGTIVATQLKAVDFYTFNAADALEVIKADIMEEIRKAYRGCSAESLADYYRTGTACITRATSPKHNCPRLSPVCTVLR